MQQFQIQLYRPQSGLLLWELGNLPIKIPIAALSIVATQLKRDLTEEELCGYYLCTKCTSTISCALLTFHSFGDTGQNFAQTLLVRFEELYGEEMNDFELAVDASLYINFKHELAYCIRQASQSVISDILQTDRSVTYILCALQKSSNIYTLLCSTRKDADDSVDEVSLLSSIAPSSDAEKLFFEKLKDQHYQLSSHTTVILTISNKLSSLSLYTFGRLALVIKHMKQTPPRDITTLIIPGLCFLCDMFEKYDA